MILLIGGAYQGKLDHARKTYHLSENDIFTCAENFSDSNDTSAEHRTHLSATECPDAVIPTIDFSKRCIDRIEKFTLACVRNNISSVDYFREHQSEWTDSILICQDIFCGVVPLGADMRAWRNETGRLCQYLSGKAAHVSRIFCGLEQQLK